ncbi:hypothetical protein F511_39993 [Dorcoceras hygrometricum]|uniref:Uncharacterized protein n=1 Tax=Dorcoceras hygrometricum TaxID=472368 RepID=A0A2Z7C0F7_9LAMI|nr:hypothetical protein F511_39993 [Dorcoceras hygrometricum]
MTYSHTPHAAADRPSPPAAVAIAGFSRDRTCFDHRDEENPFVLKSVRSSSADLWRKIVSVVDLIDDLPPPTV